MENFREPAIDAQTQSKSADSPLFWRWLSDQFARTRRELQLRPRVLYSSAQNMVSVASGVEQTLLDIVIPANNFVYPGAQLQIKVFGICVNPGNAKTINIKIGGLTWATLDVTALNYFSFGAFMASKGETSQVVELLGHTAIDFTSDVHLQITATTIAALGEITVQYVGLTYTGV